MHFLTGHERQKSKGVMVSERLTSHRLAWTPGYCSQHLLDTYLTTP